MVYRAHAEFDTKLPPDKVIAALTDFSAGRPSKWPNIDPSKYKVHEVHDTWALVTEGNRTPNIWARERYDWSQPGVVSWTVEQSDFCAPGSSVTASVTPAQGGGSHVALDWQRTPTTWASRFYLAVIPLMANRMLGQDMRRTLDRLADDEKVDETGSSRMRPAA
jgi:hypothetical protein